MGWQQLVMDDLWDAKAGMTPRGLCVASTLGAAVVSYIAFYIAHWFSPLISRQYSKLPYSERQEWDTRYFSCFHAWMVSYLAYVSLVQEDTFTKASSVPVLHRGSYATYLCLGSSLGYFLVDFVICIKYKVGGSAMAYHHVAALASVIWASWSGFGHLPTVWLLATEFTTPFINLRWWLDKANMKSSRVYFYNGIAIGLSWLFARILTFIPFYFMVWRVRKELAVCDIPTHILLLGVPVLLSVLNCYWFWMIIKGVAKLLAGGQKKPAGGAPEGLKKQA